MLFDVHALDYIALCDRGDHPVIQNERGNPEHVLRNIGQNQIGRNRRHLVQARFPELTLDVVLAGKPEPAMELEQALRLPRMPPQPQQSLFASAPQG